MEIEYKYRLKSDDEIDRLFQSREVLNFQDLNSQEVLYMDAYYLDTKDLDLSKAGLVLRIRQEGSRFVATLKWNGIEEEGHFRREEINIPASEEDLKNPSIKLFSQSNMYRKLEEVTDNKPLNIIMEMKFSRRQVRLDTGKSISLLSADSGEIIGSGRKLPIKEMELELYSGSEEDMDLLARSIAKTFNLEPEAKSKFARGLTLLGDVE